MHVEDHEPISELHRCARMNTDRLIVDRITAVIQAREGKIAREIAADIGRHISAVQEWIRWYNERGICGLIDRQQGGPTTLPRSHEKAFMACIDKGIEDDVGSVDEEAICKILKEKFDVQYSPLGVFTLMHRLGYKWRPSKSSPDDVHRNTFIEAVQNQHSR